MCDVVGVIGRRCEILVVIFCVEVWRQSWTCNHMVSDRLRGLFDWVHTMASAKRQAIRTLLVCFLVCMSSFCTSHWRYIDSKRAAFCNRDRLSSMRLYTRRAFLSLYTCWQNSKSIKRSCSVSSKIETLAVWKYGAYTAKFPIKSMSCISENR